MNGILRKDRAPFSADLNPTLSELRSISTLSTQVYICAF